LPTKNVKLLRISHLALCHRKILKFKLHCSTTDFVNTYSVV
jgi:hypothetical protein